MLCFSFPNKGLISMILCQPLKPPPAHWWIKININIAYKQNYGSTVLSELNCKQKSYSFVLAVEEMQNMNLLHMRFATRHDLSRLIIWCHWCTQQYNATVKYCTLEAALSHLPSLNLHIQFFICRLCFTVEIDLLHFKDDSWLEQLRSCFLGFDETSGSSYPSTQM